jgi:hypothetical protein
LKLASWHFPLEHHYSLRIIGLIEHTVSISRDRLASKLDPDEADTIRNIKLVDGFRRKHTERICPAPAANRKACAAPAPRQGRADVCAWPPSPGRVTYVHRARPRPEPWKPPHVRILPSKRRHRIAHQSSRSTAPSLRTPMPGFGRAPLVH